MQKISAPDRQLYVVIGDHSLYRHQNT